MDVVRTAVVYSVYLSLAFLAVLASTAVIGAVRHGGRRRELADDPKAVSASRFTIPVSLITPFMASTSTRAALATVDALLTLNYAELEVIAIAENLDNSAWTALKDAWKLEAKEFFYRQTLPTAAVRKIYRSARDPRLMIVDKNAAGRGDALNCGVNLARFRYVSAIDPDIVFDRDALLRAMAAPLLDPANVVAATCHLEVRGDGDRLPSLFDALQRLRSARSLMETRLAWHPLRTGLSPQDSVVTWRRDAILLAGGFSIRAADPDLDLMGRLHAVAPAIDGRVVRSAEIFGRVDPRPLAARTQRLVVRQRAALESVWSFQPTDENGARGIATFTVLELLVPLAQAWTVCVMAAGAVLGWYPWQQILLLLVVLSLGQAMVSAAALLLRGGAAHAPDEATVDRLLMVAPFEYFLSAAASAWSRGVGICAFVKSAWTARPLS